MAIYSLVEIATGIVKNNIEVDPAVIGYDGDDEEIVPYNPPHGFLLIPGSRTVGEKA